MVGIEPFEFRVAAICFALNGLIVIQWWLHWNLAAFQGELGKLGPKWRCSISDRHASRRNSWASQRQLKKRRWSATVGAPSKKGGHRRSMVGLMNSFVSPPGISLRIRQLRARFTQYYCDNRQIRFTQYAKDSPNTPRFTMQTFRKMNSFHWKVSLKRRHRQSGRRSVYTPIESAPLFLSYNQPKTCHINIIWSSWEFRGSWTFTWAR